MYVDVVKGVIVISSTGYIRVLTREERGADRSIRVRDAKVQVLNASFPMIYFPRPGEAAKRNWESGFY